MSTNKTPLETTDLAYDVFINASPPQDGVLPNGEPKAFTPVTSTLIYGRENAVLTDPGFTTDHAQKLGDWVAAHGRKLTDIFITHGHGDHWFAAASLAERFGARIIASEATIAQMHANAAARPLLWDQIYPGLIPPSPVTAVAAPNNRFRLEGNDFEIVEVGQSDSADTSVLHVPALGLVVAGDVIYNGAHMYIAERAIVGDFGPWRAAIEKVAALNPRHVIAGHQGVAPPDDDGPRTIAETRQYLDVADELLKSEKTATDFFNAMIERYPDYLGRTVLWAGASALYRFKDNPEKDVREAILAGWL